MDLYLAWRHGYRACLNKYKYIKHLINIFVIKNIYIKKKYFYNFEIHKHYFYIVYFTKYIRIEKIILLHKLPYFKHTLIVHMFGVKNIFMYVCIYFYTS